MTIILNEVQKIKVPASKPGNIIDKYVKVQNINNAVTECSKEINKIFITEKILTFDKIDNTVRKWLEIKK